MGLFRKEEPEPQGENYIPIQQDFSQPPMVSIPYPMLGREKSDLLDKIKPENTIEGIRFRLMGYELKGMEWIPVPYLKEFAVSQRGAWELTNLIFSASNQSISISNLDEPKIKNRALATVTAAIKMMIDYWKEYNIKSTSQIEYLAEIIFNITFITLHQPLNAGIQNLIKGTTSEQRTYVEAPQARKGLFSMLFKR